MAAVHDAIEDSVGQGWIVEIGVPMFDGSSVVSTLFEQDQLLIGNALDIVGHGLCK